MIEELRAFYSDTRIPLKKQFRLTRGGNRYYYDEDFIFRIGVTSFLSSTMKTPYWLEQWKKTNPEHIVKQRAEDGTQYHIHVANAIRAYISGMKFNLAVSDNDEMRQDLIGFLSWVQTAKPEPLILEGQLHGGEMLIAATLDFFGFVTIEVEDFYGEVYKTGDKKGLPKKTKQPIKVLAVIDWKTSIKKESETESDAKIISMYNKLQLNYQRYFIEKTFPEYSNIKMFNVITKDWRTNPGVQVSEIELISNDILESYYKCCLTFYPELFNIGDRKVIDISGDFNGSNINELYEILTVKEYCKRQMF
jgi:hypothetical protein